MLKIKSIFICFFSIIANTVISQNLTASWQPALKGDLVYGEFDERYVIHADDNFYYQFELAYDYKYGKDQGQRFYYKLHKYNNQHQEIGVITFQKAIEKRSNLYKINKIIFTNNNIVISVVEFNSVDSISKYLFKTIDFDLKEQSEWINLGEFKQNIEFNSRVEFLTKTNQVLMLSTIHLENDTTNYIRYKLLNVNSLKIEKENKVETDLPIANCTDFGIYEKNNNEILIKVKKWSNNPAFHLLKLNLSKNILIDIPFETELKNAVLNECKLENNNFTLVSLLSKKNDEEVKYSTVAEKYNFDANTLTISDETDIPKEVYNDKPVKGKIIFGNDLQYSNSTESPIIKFNLLLAEDKYYVTTEAYKTNLERFQRERVSGSIRQIEYYYVEFYLYKGFNAIEFNNDNKINWNKFIEWKTARLLKNHIGYASLINNNQLNMLFYDNVKNYEKDGLFKTNEEYKKTKGDSKKVVTLISFDSNGKMVRKIDPKNKSLLAGKLKKPYLIFNIEDNPNSKLVKFGNSYFSQYQFKRLHSVGLIKFNN